MDEKMGEKHWRLEVTNPLQIAQGSCWKRLWEFDDDQVAAYKALIEELNRINDPVQLRIVGNSAWRPRG